MGLVPFTTYDLVPLVNVLPHQCPPFMDLEAKGFLPFIPFFIGAGILSSQAFEPFIPGLLKDKSPGPEKGTRPVTTVRAGRFYVLVGLDLGNSCRVKEKFLRSR